VVPDLVEEPAEPAPKRSKEREATGAPAG
jgi:hypothetical protein